MVSGRVKPPPSTFSRERDYAASIFPDVTEWPCHVHICLPKEGGSWDHGPYRIADWGVIEPKA
jgi:hypothetical protein